jgi:hypothetical protein
MSALVRIVYISRSTFAPPTGSDRIDPGLARILAKSRKNNRAANIVGGLLFGDGCFLQCLEGAPEAVDRLYNIIAADPRHKDVKTILRVPIERVSFSAWSMKFVPMEQRLRKLLAAQGLRRFDPYAFTADDVQAVLAILQAEHDPSQNHEPALLDSAGETRPVQHPHEGGWDRRRASTQPALGQVALTRANWALAVALLSLVMVLAAVLRHAL